MTSCKINAEISCHAHYSIMYQLEMVLSYETQLLVNQVFRPQPYSGNIVLKV